MAQSYITKDGVQLIIPGTYVSVEVESKSTGTATIGVVTIIGEANEGPDWTQEEDISNNSYGPDQLDSVLVKYGSGRIVEAFRKLTASADDPAIAGSVNEIIIIKTNKSVAANASYVKSGFGEYAVLEAKKRGSKGNLIKYRSEVSVLEVNPTSGSVTYIPHYSGTAVTYDLRNNGGTKKAINAAQKTDGPSVVSSMEDVALGILAQGGTEFLPLTGLTGQGINFVASQTDELTVTLTVGDIFASVPVAGDTIVIPAIGDFSAAANSSIIGGSNGNEGAYIVTSVTNTATLASVVLKKINGANATDNETGSGTILADVRDIVGYKSVEFQNLTGQNRKSVHGIEVADGVFTSTITGPNVILDLPSGKEWTAKPKIGDTFKLTADFAGILIGFYQITSVSSSSASMTRLSEGSAGVSSTEAVATTVVDGSEPFIVEKVVVDGLGKSLEVNGDVSSIFFNGITLVAASLSNTLLTSSSEYENSWTFSRGTSEETFLSGGEILLRVGTNQELATIVISDTSIDFKINAATVFTANFTDYKTLADVITLINSNSGWSGSLVNNRLSAVNPIQLDNGTYNVSSSIEGNETSRIKRDAVVWESNVSGSSLAKATLSQQTGLPEEQTPDQFLASGSKAGSTSADFVSAIDAAQSVETNFITTLISADSTEDIATGDTESTSTYTIDAINTYLKSHVLQMSQIKIRRNRLSIVSKDSSTQDAEDAAGDLSTSRATMVWQRSKDVNTVGKIEVFQPWMSAVAAIGMQAAAGYKGIVKKKINISGISTKDNDFNPKKVGELERVLKSGLLPIEPINTGGFRWVSDQTTYSIDNNFVFNSIQAMYISDLITLDLIQTYDRLVVGKSRAQISAPAALAILESKMSDYKILRWIAPSIGAPLGYTGAKVKVVGPALIVDVEIKLAGLIYFVPIALTLSQVEQEAA